MDSLHRAESGMSQQPSLQQEQSTALTGAKLLHAVFGIWPMATSGIYIVSRWTPCIVLCQACLGSRPAAVVQQEQSTALTGAKLLTAVFKIWLVAASAI